MSYKVERIEAKRLYLEENLSLEDIQKRMPQVLIASLYRWSAEEKWDAEREEVAMTAFSSHRTILKMITKKLDEDREKRGDQSWRLRLSHEACKDRKDAFQRRRLLWQYYPDDR